MGWLSDNDEDENDIKSIGLFCLLYTYTSPSRRSAINPQIRPRDIGARIRQQKHHRAAILFRPGDPLEHGLLFPDCSPFLVREDFLCHWRVDDAGADGVYADGW